MKRDREGNEAAPTAVIEHPPPPPPRALRNGIQQEHPPPPPPRPSMSNGGQQIPRPPPRRLPSSGEAEPPPPPPRVSALSNAQCPPPPPPRTPSSNGTKGKSVGRAAHAPSLTPAANGFRVSGHPTPNVCTEATNTSKRAKPGIEPPRGWRARADEILSGNRQGGVGSGFVGGVHAVEGFGQRPVPDSRRKFAAVCSANFNRSMMAHKFLQEHRFHVQSYGTGRDVRLPGKDINSPEVFAFGTPYRDMYDILKSKDEDFFRKNNLLGLVARNAAIKAAPQRFQDIEGPDVADFDVVICFDSRVFYLVVEDLQSRDPETFKPLHVVNMTIKDSPEESAAAAGDVLDLCRTLDAVSLLEEEAAGALDAFTKRTRRTVLHQVCHV